MRKITAILVAAAAVTLGLGLAAGPAQASMVGPAGYITLYDGCTGGSSSNHTVGYCGLTDPESASSHAIGSCFNVRYNDKTSAFSNNSPHDYGVYTTSCGYGSYAVLHKYTQTGQMDNPFNNTISAMVRLN